jgi:hypothetical protein
MRIPVALAILAAGTAVLLARAPQPHRLGPPEIYPDPTRTPGAANPQVTQRNIQDNICNRQWAGKLSRSLEVEVVDSGRDI